MLELMGGPVFVSRTSGFGVNSHTWVTNEALGIRELELRSLHKTKTLKGLFYL